MRTTDTQVSDPTDTDRLLDLIVELARALHAVSVPSDVVEELLQRISRRLGARTQLLALQSVVLAQVAIEERSRFELLRIPFDTHWRLEQMQQVLQIARDLADGNLGAEAARTALAAARSRPPEHGLAVVVLAYGVYSAAVAARIGGALLEMLAGALVGLVAGLIHIGTIGHEQVNLQKSFLAGFAGSACVFALALVLPALGQSQALFGGMTLLVPAMVITIGLHELSSGALESGVPRICYGLLRFALIAAGIAAAAHIWKLIAAVPASGTPAALPIGVVLAIVAVGGLALIVCLQARWQDAPWVVGGALLAYAAQEVTKSWVGDRGAPLASAFALGTAAYLQARVTRRTPALVIIPGLLQLAPGFLGTKAVLSLIIGSRGENTFFDVMLVALQLSIGLLLAPVLFRGHDAGKRAAGPSVPMRSDPTSRYAFPRSLWSSSVE